jgi:hypothetical protein
MRLVMRAVIETSFKMLWLFDQAMPDGWQIVRTWDVEIGGFKLPLIRITGCDNGPILRPCF